ncbi:MAG: electron transport complex subunit RsxC [Magnetococcus sp. DMHC-6]
MGIALTTLRSFHGGVHPADNKSLSAHRPIERLPLPKMLYVPLHQHLGTPCEPCVKPGDKVLKGDLIGEAQGFVSVPVHAPTSGTVLEIKQHTVGHPSGFTMLCVVIEPDGRDMWRSDLVGIKTPLQVDPSEIKKKIQEAGIVGLGGATFPSHIKMSPPKGKVVSLLLINGVECEPYLTCDARLMQERAREIVLGITIMMHALQTKECVIGIEANKPMAISAMRKVVDEFQQIKVAVLPVMYPQGAEKQLIEVVTGRQVPSGGLPIDVGVIVHNVATAVAIREAVEFGRPLISRLVTVTGKGVKSTANLEVLLGTPVQDLINFCGGLTYKTKKVIMGGPMMGTALHNLEAPVVKGTSGILALTSDETTFQQKEQNCIRCGSCLKVCPIRLMPCEMAWHSKHENLDALKEYNLFDCIECGSCAFVCPAHIPLVHYFRFGKISILAQKQADQAKQKVKERSQRKEARIAKEEAEKERKKAEMKAQSDARKAQAAMTAAQQTAESKPSETAKAETPVSQEAPTSGGTISEDDDKSVRAARAAKAAAAARAAKEARDAKTDAN